MSDIAGEYGGALYALACEEKKEKALLSEVRAVREIILSYPKYISLLSSPDIPKNERIAVVDDAFGGRTDEYICSFLKLMTERGYADFIIPCFNEYERLWYKGNNTVTAFIESALPLTDEQKERLKTNLSARLNKNVELECSVNPSVIGGLRLRADGELFDGSVRTKLEGIREKLADVTL